MNHSEYQEAAARTLPSREIDNLPMLALGLVAETSKNTGWQSHADSLWYLHGLLSLLYKNAGEVLLDVTQDAPLPNAQASAIWDAAQVAEIIQKWVYLHRAPDEAQLLWHIRRMVLSHSQMLKRYEMTLAECYRRNITYLLARYPDGFVRGGGYRG